MLPREKKTLILRSAILAVSLLICQAAYWAVKGQAGPPWYSILPPLIAVTMALLTNRLFLSLATAILSGGLLSVIGDSPRLVNWLVDGVARGAGFILGTLYEVEGFEFDVRRFDVGNLQILLFVVFVISMISVMLVGGGLQGVANWLLRFARSVRSTKLVTMISGLVIFIDDYANTMIVGPTLRPVTDRQRISREKLAFLVDATAAPVAGIALVSTWIGYEVGMLSSLAQDLSIDKGGYEIFLDALGFRFYCFGMIAFVFFNSYSGQDFGPMEAAERRARETGKLLDDDAKLMTSEDMSSAEPYPTARVHASVAVVPVVVLLLTFLSQLWLSRAGIFLLVSDPGSICRLAAWRQVMTEVDSIPLLAWSSGVGLLAAVLLAWAFARVPTIAILRAMLMGVRSSLLPVTVLILAWSLKATCDELRTGEFLANVLGDSIPPMIFPALVFIVAGLTSFATGTSFGTMAILIPTAIPVAFQLDGGVYGLVTIISIGAVLDGAIFGDHCSPISDTTIMSSTASSCDHLAHVRTQMPYSLVVATFALSIGYLPAAMGFPNWFGIAGVALLAAVLFLGLKVFRGGRQATSQP